MSTFIFQLGAKRMLKQAIGNASSVIQWLLCLCLLGLQPSWGHTGPIGFAGEIGKDRYGVYRGDEGGSDSFVDGSCPTIVITRQPISTTACTGNGLQYSVQVEGTNLTYDWEFNDGNGWASLSPYAGAYPGYNTAVLTTNGQEADGRQYRVKVDNGSCSATSQPATFTKLVSSLITQQPISRTACSSRGLQYSVQVEGTNLTYDWEFNDGSGWTSLSSYSPDYPGYNTAVLTIRGDEPSGRQYRVQIINGSCSGTSRPATFTNLASSLITRQPISTTACTGNGLQYSVQVEGTNLTYDWEFNDGNGWASLRPYSPDYPGYNTAVLTTNGQEADGRQYRVKVDNGSCSATSQPATFTKQTALITQQPADQIACSSRGLQYAVQVKQEANLSYNWEYKDGSGWASLRVDTSAYPGYNTAVLTTRGDEPSGRQYRAKVDNGSCSIYSSPVTFTKLRPVIMTQQPISRTNCSGKGLTYSVKAEGDDLAYDWEFKDNDGKGWISLSNFADAYPDYYTSTLTTTENEPSGRQYRVKIINDCGSVYSDPAFFIRLTPVITRQPISQTACSDRSNGLRYSVQADTSGSPLTYAWEFKDNDGKGWVPLSNFADYYPGYNTATMTTNGVETPGRQYQVKITNRCGVTLYSQSATFTLTTTPPAITQQPISHTVCSGNGDGLTYSVKAAGDDLTYEWEFKDPAATDWASLGGQYAHLYPGYDTPTLTTNGTEANGRQYRVKIMNRCGSTVYSEAATLTIAPAPTITQQPQSRTACSGSTNGLTYAVVVESTVPVTYEWEFKDPTTTNWASLGGQYAHLYPGYDKPTLTTNGTEANGRQYRVKVMTGTCTTYSQAATLTIAPAPTITQQPQNRTACSGSTNGLTYAVVVESTVPVTYEWEFKDPAATDWASLGGQYAHLYPGYDTPTLTTNGTEANGRQYRVKIMTGTCTVYSQVATFTLAPPPTITQQPQSRTACSGSTNGLTYTVVVESTVPVTYEWEFKDPTTTNWASLGGQYTHLYPGYDTPTLTTNGTEANGRQYRVKINNGCVYSNPATLTLAPPPTITRQPQSRIACSGKGLTYSVQADGQNLTYEWEFKDTDSSDWTSLSGYASAYPGYDTATLTTNGTESNGRQYRVKVMAGTCTVYSQPAIFTQSQCTPTLTNFSASPTSVTPGQPIEFTATVGGVTAPYNYTLSNGAGSDQTGTASGSNFSQRLTAQGNGPQTYTLTIGNSPYTVTGTTVVTVASFAITDLKAFANPVQSGQSVEFTATFEGLTDTDLYKYTLTNGQEPMPLTGNFYGSSFRESIIARGAGVQVFTLTVVTRDKGTATAAISVTVVGQDVGQERFAIAGVKDVSCETLSENQRQLRFTPQYEGIDAEPISFSVVNELLPTTQPGPYSLRLYIDNPTITMVARQGNAETKYSYNWLASCSSTSPRTFTLTGAQMVNCQLEEDGDSKRYKISLQPQYAGQSNTQPISFSVVNELSPTTDPGPYTLRLWGDNPTITIIANQGNAEARYSYNWLANCPSTSPGSFTLTGTRMVDCQLEDADGSKRYKVSLQPQYAGQSNTQPVSFSVVNELSPTTEPGPYTLRLWGDNPTITMVANQGRAEAKYVYNWRAGCQAASGARLVAIEEFSAGMQVKLLGNPVTDHQVRVELNGVEGQSVDLTLTDLTGRQLTSERIERSAKVEQLTLRTSPAWGGVLLLRVCSSSQQQIMRVIQSQ